MHIYTHFKEKISLLFLSSFIFNLLLLVPVSSSSGASSGGSSGWLLFCKHKCFQDNITKTDSLILVTAKCHGSTYE